MASSLGEDRMRTMGVALAMGLMGARGALGQDTSAVVRSDSLACEGRRVTAIVMSSRARIAVDSVRPAFVRPFVRAVLRTKPSKGESMLPWLLLRPGHTCTEARRREGERLLRDLRYVANARVHAEPDGDGVRLMVEATDDLRPVAGIRLDGAMPDYLQYGSTSLGGSGMLVAGEWTDGGTYRDGFGVRVTDWTTFGRRTISSLDLVRRPLGQLTLAAIGEPYLTRFQNVAWQLALRNETQYVPLERNRDSSTAWRTEWHTFDVAGVRRVQVKQVQLLAGGMFTYERISPDDSGVVIGPRGLLPPTAAGLGDRYLEQDGGRAGVVLGFRALTFRPVQGLEALEGTHDVARGVQVAAVLGKGVAGDDGHAFSGVEAYAGVGGATAFASARATLERRDAGPGRPSRMTNARVVWYWLASRRQTQEVTVEFTSAWREDLPLALFLDDRTGPRGFDGATASGTRLLVTRVERRVRTGGFARAAGLGVALFADAAKLWAGGAPLGATTDPLVGAGAALLVAIPRDSRKTIRVETAYPLTRVDGAGGLSVRVTITTAGRAYRREAAGFSRSRIAPALRSLVGWF